MSHLSTHLSSLSLATLSILNFRLRLKFINFSTCTLFLIFSYHSLISFSFFLSSSTSLIQLYPSPSSPSIFPYISCQLPSLLFHILHSEICFHDSIPLPPLQSLQTFSSSSSSQYLLSLITHTKPRH